MRHIIILLFSMMLIACDAGSGEGLDNNGQPIADSPGETPPVDDPAQLPTLTSLQEQVLTPICAQCHSGNNAPVGLRLDSVEASMANLIDVSSSNPQYKRVLVGDADNSYLYLKITGNPIAGNRMPLGQAPLSDDIIGQFKDWINNGAQISAEAPVVTQALLRNTAGVPAGLLLTFSQPMLTDSVSSSQIELVVLQSSSTTPSPAALEIPLSVQATWRDNRSLYIGLPANELSTAKARITLNNPALSTVLSQLGIELDGDRNGTPGGLYRYEILF